MLNSHQNSHQSKTGLAWSPFFPCKLLNLLVDAVEIEPTTCRLRGEGSLSGMSFRALVSLNPAVATVQFRRSSVDSVP